MIVLTMAARNLPPFARWPLAFFIIPAYIFNPVSPPTWSFRRCRRGICLLLPAGRYRSSPHRRAFLILFLRRIGRLDAASGDFSSFLHAGLCLSSLTGVHFSSRFSAGVIVLTMAARNLSPFARWPLPFFASPAYIFYSVSPLAAAVLCFAGVHF